MVESKSQRTEPTPDSNSYLESSEPQTPGLNMQVQETRFKELEEEFLDERFEIPNSTGVSSFQSNPDDKSEISPVLEEIQQNRKLITDFFSTVKALLTQSDDRETQTDRLMKGLPTMFRQLEDHSNPLCNAASDVQTSLSIVDGFPPRQG